jgi:hydroxypyruvate isomerase
MLRFAANLVMSLEVDFLERLASARASGFRGV